MGKASEMSVRRRELAAVLSHVREGVSVEVRGAWGSGRSALLRGAERAVRQEGFDTLSVSGEFALRTHALEALDVAGVRPSPGVESPISARIDALAGRVLARPTLILVDDAAAVDAESWGVISVVQRLTDVPVLYALDAHAPEGSGAVHVLERRVVRVVLPPLRYEEVRALLEDVLGGGVDAHTAGRVFSKSGGLPRLVVAVARAGRQHGILSESAGTWHAGDDLWHPALAPHLTEILYPLTAPLREGLEVLAVAGIVTIERCTRLIGSTVLEELEARGLVSVFQNGARVMVAVNPPLIAEYYRHQPISARRVRLAEHVAIDQGGAEAWEGAAATATATATAQGRRSSTTSIPSSPLSPSIMSATLGSRPASLEWEAVRNPAVGRLVTEHRRSEVSRALEAWRDHPGVMTAVTAVDALAHDAGPDADRRAQEILDATVYAEGEPGASLALLGQRANRAIVAEAAARSRALVQAGLHERADAPPRTDGWEAQPELPVGLSHVIDHARAHLPGLSCAVEAVGLEAEIRAQGFSPESEQRLQAVIDGVAAENAALTGRGPAADEASIALADVFQARGWFIRAVALLDATGRSAHENVYWRRRRQRVTALALFGAGRIDEALSRSTEWRDEALAALDAEALRDQSYVCALALVHTGRNTEADDAIGAALALGEPTLSSREIYGGILVLGAIVAARRGEIDVADSLTAQARRWLPQVSSLPLAAVPFAEAHIAHARGDEQAARRLLTDAHAEFARRGFAVQAAITEVMALESMPDIVSLPHSAALEGNLFEPLLDYLRGVEGAEADWIESAGDRLRAANQVVHAAGAYLRAADAYRRDGRPDDADRAERLAQSLGGTLDAEVMAHVQAQASRPTLTQREREITALAAGGTPNQTIATRLSVSVRTVENHLNRAFRKLGISRRDELEAVRSLWAEHPHG